MKRKDQAGRKIHMPTTIKTKLEHYCHCNGFTLGKQQINNLEIYISMVQEWNKVINITGHKDLDDLILKDIIDNLYLDKIINQHHIHWNSAIDLGCGAGFSGIILSILHPDKKIAFLDSDRKKINFVKHVCRELKLKNTEFFQERVEEGREKGTKVGANNPIKRGSLRCHLPLQVYDLAISRATWGIEKYLKVSKNYVQNNGHAIYFCGKNQVKKSKIEKNTFFSLNFNEFYFLSPSDNKRQIISLKSLK